VAKQIRGNSKFCILNCNVDRFMQDVPLRLGGHNQLDSLRALQNLGVRFLPNIVKCRHLFDFREAVFLPEGRPLKFKITNVDI